MEFTIDEKEMHNYKVLAKSYNKFHEKFADLTDSNTIIYTHLK